MLGGHGGAIAFTKLPFARKAFANEMKVGDRLHTLAMTACVTSLIMFIVGSAFALASEHRCFASARHKWFGIQGIHRTLAHLAYGLSSQPRKR